MSTSVIIVSYHTGPVLEDCVRAARRSPLTGDIVLVDNGNHTQVQAWMDAFARADGNTTILRGHGNIGFSKACNAGVRASKGTHLLFLNPDAVLQEGALEALHQALNGAPKGSIAGARLLNTDGSEQRGSRRGRLTPWAALVSMTGLSRFESLHPLFTNMHQEKHPLPDGPAAVHAVSGACLLIKREDFEQLGGYDEGYFLHVEDLDLCRRVRKAGGQALFVPAATVVHHGSTSHVHRLFVDWHKAKGLARYYYRFAHSPAEKLGALLLAIPVMTAVMIRSVLISLRSLFG